MTQNNQFSSPFASPDFYFLEELVSDLNLPLYTGDFDAASVDKRDKLFAKLNRDYAILLDTISLIDKLDGDWHWQEFDSVIPQAKLAKWLKDWGNPGPWYEPLPLADLQKHAMALHLIYQVFYYSQLDDIEAIEELTAFYSLLLKQPDFDKRQAPDRQHMARFKSQPQHRQARVNHLVSTIIEHEVQTVRMAYAVERGFSMRAASLLPVMYYQMGILLRSPSGDFQKIRQCANCNAYFWGHGNRRYCYKNECDRRRVHKRKKRGVK